MERTLLIFSIFLFSFQAFAGANGSGGGKAVVCKNADSSIKSVELLDLWEARVIYSRTTVPSSLSVADQVEQSLQNLKNSIYAAEMCVGNGVVDGYCDGVKGPEALYQLLKFETDRFLAPNLPQVHRMKGVTLKKTDDTFEVVTPNDCTIEQVVRYKDTAYGGDILINQDLVDYMDETNEAALYIHEAYYAFLRRYGEKSSLRVRRAVGMAFNGHRFQALESFLPGEYYECSNENQQSEPFSRILVYTPESGMCAGKGVTTQVVNLAGLKMLDFNEPDFCEGRSIDDIFDSKSPLQIWQPFGRSIGFDYSIAFSIGGLGNGARVGKVQLEDAPDQPPSPVITVNCVLKFKDNP